MKKIALIILIFSLYGFAQNNQWEQIPANICYSLYSASVVDENTVWIGGDFGFVVRTKDSGKSWNVFKPFNKSIYNIFASSINKCFVAGSGDDQAQIFRTIDGGRNWEKVYEVNAKDAFINFIYMFDDINGYVEGDPINGKFLLLKTTDGGSSWQNAASVPANEGQVGYNNSMFWLGQYGWFGGNDSSIYLSKNQGMTWKRIQVNLKKIWGICFIDSLNGILCGKDTVLYASHDGGESWQAIKIPKLEYYPSAVSMTDKNTIWYLSGNKIYRSPDSGNTWEMTCEADRFIRYMQIKKIDNNIIGWAVGNDGLVLRFKQ